jgi:hypothetical protein
MRGARSHAYKRHEISYKVTKAPKAKYVRLSLRCPPDDVLRKLLVYSGLIAIIGPVVAWLVLVVSGII